MTTRRSDEQVVLQLARLDQVEGGQHVAVGAITRSLNTPVVLSRRQTTTISRPASDAAAADAGASERWAIVRASVRSGSGSAAAGAAAASVGDGAAAGAESTGVRRDDGRWGRRWVGRSRAWSWAPPAVGGSGRWRGGGQPERIPADLVGAGHAVVGVEDHVDWRLQPTRLERQVGEVLVVSLHVLGDRDERVVACALDDDLAASSGSGGAP